MHETDSSSAQGELPLIAFETASVPPVTLRRAPVRRTWMDETHEGFAYRCLPLVMACQVGWEALCPAPFAAIWNGGPAPSDIEIAFAAEENSLIESHFGHGVLTFATGYLFRTPPGHNLWVKGPANRPKDGIAPLEGLVEADWGPFTFTMNWRFTRPGHAVSFERGEPFVSLVPFPRHYVERFAPVVREIGSDPALSAAFLAWRKSRRQFNIDLDTEGSEAQDARWQKHYMHGEAPDGDRIADHERRVAMRPFERDEPENLREPGQGPG